MYIYTHTHTPVCVDQVSPPKHWSLRRSAGHLLVLTESTCLLCFSPFCRSAKVHSGAVLGVGVDPAARHLKGLRPGEGFPVWRQRWRLRHTSAWIWIRDASITSAVCWFSETSTSGHAYKESRSLGASNVKFAGLQSCHASGKKKPARSCAATWQVHLTCAALSDTGLDQVSQPTRSPPSDMTACGLPF